MNIGVIVGRFQVAELHEGHRHLINTALKNHERVMIFLGIPFFEGTTNDPLDFETRAKMIQAEFPTVLVLPIKDVPSNEVWSANLDAEIMKIFPRVESVTMYSGRAGFISEYRGKWVGVELSDMHSFTSGSAVRQAIGRNPRYSSDFRAGQIYSTQNQWPYIRMAVDLAILKEKDGELSVLLGKKPHELNWRFPGGFVDLKDQNLLQAAKRELSEELPNIVAENLKFIGSTKIFDYRLKDFKSMIMTAVFMGYEQWGATTAGDDLSIAQYHPLKQVIKDKSILRNEHVPILDLLRKELNNGPKSNPSDR